jgi:hypothetical protein
MADEKDSASDEPLYEPIGGGQVQHDDKDDPGDAFSPGGQARLLVRSALATALVTVRSGRFWWESAAILGVGIGAGTLLVIALVTGGDLPPESHTWVYILTAAMLVLVSCVLAIRWAQARRGAGPDPAAESGVDGPLLDWARCSAKGLIFATVSVVFLLLLAFWSDSSPAVAGVSFVLIILEVMVFSGIGAGAARWFEDQRGRVLAWGVAALLLVGNVVAVIALLPSVRAYEPVLVAINIQRDDFGRVTSYRCSPEFRGIAEVYHTERIFWMAASNPMVILALIAGEAGPKENALEWLPGELQNAAEGTQVPCVEGQEKTGAEMPLALIGVGTQSGAAGILLAGGHRAARRRLNPRA